MAKNQKRRKFSSPEKVRILKRHFLEKVAVSDLCDELGLQPTVFYRWQAEFFEKSANVFDRAPTKNHSREEEKVSRLEAKLTQKNEVLSELMEEPLKLKKNLGEL